MYTKKSNFNKKLFIFEFILSIKLYIYDIVDLPVK